MKGKLTWNAQKKDLWKENTKELMKKLQELETQLIKDTSKITFGAHRVECTPDAHADLKGLRHKIACIKTMLNVKLKAVV